MKRHLGILLIFTFCSLIPAQSFAAQDRAEVEARVRADVVQDLAEELQIGEWITCRNAAVCFRNGPTIWILYGRRRRRKWAMYEFNRLLLKPMISQNLSSNFLHNTQRHIGLHGIFPAAPFAHKNKDAQKPMIRFAEITPQGELSWPLTLPMNRCCVCRRFLPSFLSVEAFGGLDAGVGVFLDRSKLT